MFRYDSRMIVLGWVEASGRFSKRDAVVGAKVRYITQPRSFLYHLNIVVGSARYACWEFGYFYIVKRARMNGGHTIIDYDPTVVWSEACEMDTNDSVVLCSP